MYGVEEFDDLKQKILKYVLYKKRTENEIRQKFTNIDENMLEDAIEYLKGAGYINDEIYIEKSINEFIALKNLSIKELMYKLQSKGIQKNELESYVSNNKEKLLEFEMKSAKNIIAKKRDSMEQTELENYLYRKGYMSETVKLAFEEE